MTEHTLERRLEWEPASEPIILERVAFPVPPFFTGTRKVTFRRDHDLNLRLNAEGALTNLVELQERRESDSNVLAGTFTDLDDVIFDADGARYSLRCFFRQLPDMFSADASEHIRFSHEAYVHSLARTWSQKYVVGNGGESVLGPLGSVAWRSDWFVNGPSSAVFMRWTVRRKNFTFLRERVFGSVQASELPRYERAGDHFVFDDGTLRFAVCDVPEGLAPDWCRPISIEFWSPIPDEETREAVGEIVSFLLGRRLVAIGSTMFDETGWPIEERVTNPIGTGLRALCSKSDVPPIPFFPRNIEAPLAGLVPSYLQLRGTMDLRNALWGYWSACESSTPIDLAIFRAAVEALKKGWFASADSKSKGTYMPKPAFEELTTDLFATLQERVASHPSAIQILNKLRGAYRMTGNEEVRAFFSEIHLRLGAAEEVAMRAANVPAHGSVTTAGNLQTFVQHGRAYRTLFARTLLRLLGYDGAYVDYTTLGFPSRALDEPAGGTS